MKLLITGAWQDARNRFEEIKALGHEIFFMQWEKDELPCGYDDVEGVICNGFFLSHPIEKFTNLRYIQLTSAGFDRVPMEYVKEHGIEIHNARGVYSIPMAEFVVCGVLQLYKESGFFAEDQKQHKWEKHRGLLELFGNTVCIVGCGSVGTECAKRFKAFGCKIIGVDIAVRSDDYYDDMVLLSDFDNVLAQSDVIVLTVPLTDDTRHLINADRLSTVKETAVLINIARGAVVDTDALVEALQIKKLSGAVLDVFEEEPLNENSPLWDMENVIVTPHCSFVGEGNNNRLSSIIISNLKKV